MGPNSRWKKTDAQFLQQKLLIAAVVSVIVGVVFPFVYAQEFSIAVALAVCLSCWLILSCFINIKDKVKNASSLTVGLSRLGRAYYGMVLAHIGFALCVLGVCLTSQYSYERDLRMAPGDHLDVAGYSFKFEGVRSVTGPNYVASEAEIVVSKNKKLLVHLNPQKRIYNASRSQTMTEADIDDGLFRDLYVALGEPLSDGAWSVRVHYKPFVRWMWLGALLMGFGGALAAADQRYRLKSSKRHSAKLA
jgi:cytochrome c-type biogenesis protein CcmF